MPDSPRQSPRRPARGAGSNPASRFGLGREAAHDGWEIPDDLPPLRTEIRDERVRGIITRNASPDIGFDRSINPYGGCEHGCIYCYARPLHANLGLSSGLDFETRLTAKPDAARALEAELGRPRYEPRPIALGTATDPYQPAERDRAITRSVLQVLSDWRHPVTVMTRGALVLRDADILAPMAAKGLARVGISLTTLDAGLARAMEPRAPSPERRLGMIRALSRAGIPVRVMVSPLIPGLTDHELEAILEAARGAGAGAASCIPLRLPREVSMLFQEWLVAHAPERAAKVMARVRDLHGGRDYDPAFGARFRGQGVWADLIRRRFELATDRLGLARRVPPLRCDLFARPARAGDQLSLF